MTGQCRMQIIGQRMLKQMGCPTQRWNM